MGINDIAVSLIKSEELRNELIDSKHIFKIDEQISLIYNSDLELLYKMKLFTNLLKDNRITDEIKLELSAILSNIENFYTSLYAEETIFVFYNEFNEVKITKSFKYLQEYIKEDSYRINLNSITMINSEITDANNNVIYYFSLNKKGQVVKFYTLNDNVDYINTHLEKAYVNIPNNICDGDIVTLVDDNSEYVVINESEIPKHLTSNCTIDDCCVTVIRRDLLDTDNNDYTEKITNIFKNRIKSLKTDCDDSDNLSAECTKVSLLNVDKIFKNNFK